MQSKKQRNRHNAPYWVCTQAVSGKPVVIRGKVDDTASDYISAPDVALAVVAILRADKRPRLPAYHIGLGRAVSHRELLEAVFACIP